MMSFAWLVGVSEIRVRDVVATLTATSDTNIYTLIKVVSVSFLSKCNTKWSLSCTDLVIFVA